MLGQQRDDSLSCIYARVISSWSAWMPGRTCIKTSLFGLDTATSFDEEAGLVADFRCLFVTLRVRSSEANDARSFRFGLPTFLCCPMSQHTLLRVQRTHLRSSGCRRWHLALAFLQSSHETRRCDGCKYISLIVRWRNWLGPDRSVCADAATYVDAGEIMHSQLLEKTLF